MIAGHSDVTLGLVCGNDADMLPAINTASSIWGLASNPFDCWLTERGTGDAGPAQCAAACQKCRAPSPIGSRSNRGVIARLVSEARDDHPDHELAPRVLDGRLRPHALLLNWTVGRDAVNRFMHEAKGIPFSPLARPTAPRR